MLLAITPTVAETERLRRFFVKYHSFVYCATHQNMIRAAERYRPEAILLVLDEVTDVLVQKMAKIREILPDVALLTVSNAEDVTRLEPDIKYKKTVPSKYLWFQSMYFNPPCPQKSIFMGSYIVSGLFMSQQDRYVFLYGQLADFTPDETFLLHYLMIIHPRRATAAELGSCCFSYGRVAPRATVASRISRINQVSKNLIKAPIITCRRGEGYGIEF